MSSNFQDFAKPASARMRRPEAMVRGTPYKLTALAREKSKFPDKRSGSDVYKTLAVYKDFGMTFYTYMPYKFDNKDDKFFEDKNKEIQEGKNLRVVYYGNISGSLEIDLLDDDEDVNSEKLDGIKAIMELETSDSEPSPKKQRIV